MTKECIETPTAHNEQESYAKYLIHTDIMYLIKLAHQRQG